MLNLTKPRDAGEWINLVYELMWAGIASVMLYFSVAYVVEAIGLRWL